MKRFFLKNIVVVLASGASLFAQVPNGGFEIWRDECTPDAWGTSSICGAFMPITKTATAHSGSFAVRGEVVQIATVAIHPLLQSGPEGAGFPISERYTSVDAFYRFAPIGGDRFGFNVAFMKGETVVAQGAKFFPATTGANYEPCSTPMTYFTDDIPDTAIIQVQVIGPVAGDDYHPGSVMYVDDVTFGATAEPRLTIVFNGDTATVSWPQNVTGFRLQQTSSLAPITWSEVPGMTPADHSYTFTPTTQAFFRLISP
jgi:hypothetical protein